MVGIVITGHGEFAEGMLSAVTLLCGEQENVVTVGLHLGDDPAAFKDKVAQGIHDVDTGDGVLVLVDLFGGTPSNSATLLVHEWNRDDIYALAGINLPMTLEAIFERDGLSAGELTSHIKEVAPGTLVDIRERIGLVSDEGVAKSV